MILLQRRASVDSKRSIAYSFGSDVLDPHACEQGNSYFSPANWCQPAAAPSWQSSPDSYLFFATPISPAASSVDPFWAHDTDGALKTPPTTGRSTDSASTHTLSFTDEAASSRDVSSAEPSPPQFPFKRGPSMVALGRRASQPAIRTKPFALTPQPPAGTHLRTFVYFSPRLRCEWPAAFPAIFQQTRRGRC